jgi:hypothetical protein
MAQSETWEGIAEDISFALSSELLLMLAKQRCTAQRIRYSLPVSFSVILWVLSVNRIPVLIGFYLSACCLLSYSCGISRPL